MSEKMKKEEVKNSAVKSFLKNSVGKLAILAAAATSLSSCSHWAISHHSRHGSIQVGGGCGGSCHGGYHGGHYCGGYFSGSSCGHVPGVRYMPNKCPRGHVHY